MPRPPGATAARPAKGRRALTERFGVRQRLLIVLVGAAVIGLAAGFCWFALVRLPSYVVNADGGAVLSERGLAAVFGADAWFAVLGFGFGIVLGAWSWWWFARLGWRVNLVALAASAIGAALCWWVGTTLGPQHFIERLGSARTGDLVPVDFALRSLSALLTWPLGAVLVVMIAAAFGPERSVATRQR